MNWRRIKALLFERTVPYHYHGKKFARLETDLQEGFLHPYLNDYTDAMISICGGTYNPSIKLTRDRKNKGKFVSGLQQAQVFSQRDSEGIIYVFSPEVMNLKGYKDDGFRNVIVREPIDFHRYLLQIVINSSNLGNEDRARELVATLNYHSVSICQLRDFRRENLRLPG